MKVTTASVKERREILSELGKCVSGKGKRLGSTVLVTRVEESVNNV